MLEEYKKELSDQEILDRFYSSQDNAWLGFLLDRYVLLLFGVCMKYLKNEEEAKDAVQQVFLKTITELHRYKVVYFSSWVYKVAKNYCLMKLRSRHVTQTEPIVEHMMAFPIAEEPMGVRMDRGEMVDLMVRCLDDLNKEQKLCVTLFYLEKQSYQEIAEKTGFSMMQVKSYIQNGKRNLKIMLDRNILKQK